MIFTCSLAWFANLYILLPRLLSASRKIRAFCLLPFNIHQIFMPSHNQHFISNTFLKIWEFLPLLTQLMLYHFKIVSLLKMEFRKQILVMHIASVHSFCQLNMIIALKSWIFEQKYPNIWAEISLYVRKMSQYLSRDPSIFE